MNQIERIHDELAKRFPNLPINLDEPANEKGPWFLFAQRGEGLPHLAIEWRPDRGFGVSTPGDDEFGMGPDEVYSNAREATDRAVELIETGGRSVPPDAVRLAELRQRQGLSQIELAERAGMKQANVSRIESRGDVLVSTLAKMVEAMGGELSIRARFPGGVEQEIEIFGEKRS
ncbi:Helix-turn-helix domain-containing protein [Singulisphaera sp. GP187]|uniref:helix-turn-helix domain-containing protein n=1 Tax=Singulisphaera sp. GP187 TaxID=1882752 RepID=UPI0009282C9C|nr:helix-turn-helix transcriptional regulator [Singulisphaera sp. GP187]SIN79299.1 Helix-turn-helix domain-containing protein [Singulisphaera sp. GP187]